MAHNKETIEHTDKFKMTLATEDGVLYTDAEYFDTKHLDRVHDLRNHEVFKNSKLSLHDNEDVRAVVSCPDTMQWHMFKKNEPEVYNLLHSKSEVDRMRAVKQIEILKPEWVVYTRI